MPAQSQTRPFRQVTRAVIGIGVVVMGVSLWLAPLFTASLVPLIVFAVMLLLAERLAVEVGDKGVQVSVSLPIAVAAATLYGPAAGGLIDGVSTLIAGIALMLSSKRKRRWIWPVFNGMQSALSAACAGFAAMPVIRHYEGLLGLAVGAVVAVVTYIVVNCFVVAYVESELAGGSIWASLNEKRKVVGVQYLAYAVLAVAIVALTYHRQLWACGLFFVPMWAARQCFQLRARYDRDYRETIRALGLMMQHAHPYTGGHLDRVARFASMAALKLGLSHQDADLMLDAALLHDLGKIAISEDILNKPGKLDDHEWHEVKKHPGIGSEILAEIPMLEPVVPWIAAHHERPDGAGYPLGLTLEEIPIQARIIAVADAYDAMVGGDRPSDRRPYRVSRSPEMAIRELHDCAGTQFDERVVMAFTQVLREQGAA